MGVAQQLVALETQHHRVGAGRVVAKHRLQCREIVEQMGIAGGDDDEIERMTFRLRHRPGGAPSVVEPVSAASQRLMQAGNGGDQRPDTFLACPDLGRAIDRGFGGSLEVMRHDNENTHRALALLASNQDQSRYYGKG
jgi:hypothetical protein